MEAGKPDLMLAPMISFAARIAREKHGIRLITVHLYPAAMMSADDAPLVLPGDPVPAAVAAAGAQIRPFPAQPV